jgi:hypothetical protein
MYKWGAMKRLSGVVIHHGYYGIYIDGPSAGHVRRDPYRRVHTQVKFT